MTADGVEETTVVTAMVLGFVEVLELAGKTTVCFCVGVVSTEVDPSFDTAVALLWAWDLDRMLGTKLELGEVVTMITCWNTRRLNSEAASRETSRGRVRPSPSAWWCWSSGWWAWWRWSWRGTGEAVRSWRCSAWCCSSWGCRSRAPWCSWIPAGTPW